VRQPRGRSHYGLRSRNPSPAIATPGAVRSPPRASPMPPAREPSLTNLARQAVAPGFRTRGSRESQQRTGKAAQRQPSPDSRAIGVPLVTVKSGPGRPPPRTQVGRSEGMTACFVQIPKLIVRIRFPSPTPPGTPGQRATRRHATSARFPKPARLRAHAIAAVRGGKPTFDRTSSGRSERGDLRGPSRRLTSDSADLSVIRTGHESVSRWRA